MSKKMALLPETLAPSVGGKIRRVSLPEQIFRGIVKALALLLAFFSTIHLINISPPASALLVFPRFVATGLSFFIAVFGFLVTLLGTLFVVRDWSWLAALARKRKAGSYLRLFLGSPLTVIAGCVVTVFSVSYLVQVVASRNEFAQAFGQNWESKLPANLTPRLVQQRWNIQLATPPQPRLETITVGTVPGTNRVLTANLILPPDGVSPSGLTYLYINTGGWQGRNPQDAMDFYFATLAAQGHLVIDFTPRPRPETDVFGMVADINRTIGWVKTNAQTYQVNPDRIVLGGASAGAHLALLTAYTSGLPEFTPGDLGGLDLSVRGVVDYYAPTDLAAYYRFFVTDSHTGASFLDDLGDSFLKAANQPKVEQQTMAAITAQAMVDLLGATPDKQPERARLASPLYHVRAELPATLLFHGGSDTMSPVSGSRNLYAALKEVGVPTVYVEFPLTDHVFDLVFNQFSPANQASLYDLERFLALMASS